MDYFLPLFHLKVKEKIRYFFRSKRRREFEILGKDILNYIAKSKNIDADENTFKGKNIYEVERNGLVLSAIRQID